MQSKRGQSYTEIFGAVVEQPPNERAAFLERSCHGDAALRRKVELLLQYHDASGDFIESPAFAVVPELLVGDPAELIGQQLGSYRLEALVGAGGMGLVYQAHDERLGRKVALKLLPPSRVANAAELQRLQREARAASALNHPNIVTVHEIGQVEATPYVATEFIEGSTLRARMSQGAISPNEVLDIARQVASALSVAHRAGIVHRDIKPENIMLRPDGYVKVLDFGIAQVTPPLGIPTETGREMIQGTARYMSHEQAGGRSVDARSDLWSLGVVLYEMLKGRAPFAGKTPTDVITAILFSDPQPSDKDTAIVPPALQNVLERALRKDPAERYQTAEEMLAELRACQRNNGEVAPGGKRRARWIGVAAVVAALAGLVLLYAWRDPAPVVDPVAKSIAVLPFENLSAEPDNAYLADGIHDDVITGLAKIKDLKVIARDSVMSYRGAAPAGKLREIGRSLGVAHLLQGSVRRAGNELVVNVALVDAHNQQQEWAQHYERRFDQALRLQGELAVEIARELRVMLTPAEVTAAAAKPTENADAYLLYLRAREVEIADDGRDQFQAATKLYQRAVDLDPNFALARARLSLCASQVFYSEASPEWKARARAEAEEALRLRPELGEARLALAHCYLWGDGDYGRALGELTRTAELLPNSAEVPLTAAFIYKRQNKYRDRFAALHRAEALDPRNRRVLAYLINTFRWVRNWREARQTCDRLVALTGDAASRSWRWGHANDEFRLTGDIGSLKKALAEEADAGPPVDCNWLDLARYETAMLERDYAAAARFLSAVPLETFRELPLPLSAHSKAFDEALLAVAGNTDSKQEALEVARNETEGRLDSLGLDKPNSDLAVLYAFLGRKEEAIHQAKHAIEILGKPVGSIERNEASAALAMVYAQTGESDKAIALIEHLLTVSSDLQCGAVYNMTLVDLKWRWQWDPLRSRPRFQKLLAGPEPKTIVP
ncbi:MAG: protein kinase domain-containing protein [Chthoniobacterales bacterium]